MRPTDFHIQQKIDECKRLYTRYGGRHHELIEKEMRVRGWTQFTRRILYTRNERGSFVPGWIERFGWREPGNAGTLARTDAEASGRNLEFHQRHAAGNGVAGRVARVPAKGRIKATDDPFHAWLKQVSPSMHWDWKHQQYIYERLKAVTSGECKRLMIFLPPRHGKSELVTVRYAGWRIKQDPTLNVILGSYNQRLANRFSRKIRRVLSDDAGNAGTLACIDAAASRADVVNRKSHAGGTGMAGKGARVPTNQESPFPFTARRANSEAEWETSKGGGLRAVGVGGGVTGFGAGLIVIDDPVKSRAEAESPTYRDKIWEWFNDDLYTRLEPNGAIILIQTRWHEDDLAGRLLREMQEEDGEQWEVINLPALAEAGFTAETQRRGEDEEELTGMKGMVKNGRETPIPFNSSIPVNSSQRLSVSAVQISGDPLGRAQGEALCPERYDEAALERLRRKLGSYSFAALYQQRPVPAEGGLFKRAWFKSIVGFPPPGLRW